MNAVKRLSTRLAPVPWSKSFTLPSFSSYSIFCSKLYRNCSKCYALHLFWTHFVHEYKKLKKPSKSFILKRDDKSEIILKTQQSPNQIRSWVVFIVIQGLASLPYSSFIKSSFSRCPFLDFGKLLMQFDKSVPSWCIAWLSEAFWEPWHTDFYHYRRRKTPKNTKQKEKSNQWLHYTIFQS